MAAKAAEVQKAVNDIQVPQITPAPAETEQEAEGDQP
jgi:hypothetical protein